MFCPSCHSEYRSGFTRCATCDVDLVENLDTHRTTAPDKESEADPGPRILTSAVNYCGFLSLEDARDAREQLRAHDIRSEILIRDPHGLDPTGKADEEYWIRVAPEDVQEAANVLGYDVAEDAEDQVLCSACGYSVGQNDDSCPHCGARFEG